jgi:hypothetical protein
MTATKHCWNCQRVRPVGDFQKTRLGTDRAGCCRKCVETLNAKVRAERGRTSPATPPDRPRSNRPQMRQCAGCGETLPTRDFWYHYIRIERFGRGRRPDKVKRPRTKYCQPCYRLRMIERPCEDCGVAKPTAEFRTDREGTTPHCTDCREKRMREKHCPRCDTTKPLTDFTKSYGRPSGWCMPCTVQRNRERRAEARARKA